MSEVVSRKGSLVDLQKALDRIPRPQTWVEEDCEDSSKDVRCDNFNEVQTAIDKAKELFSCFQAEQTVKEQSLRKLFKERPNPWLESEADVDEWITKAEKVFDETFSQETDKSFVQVSRKQLSDLIVKYRSLAFGNSLSAFQLPIQDLQKLLSLETKSDKP